MASIPIALQMYSLREDSARDFPAMLKVAADAGYDGVEFAGYHGLEAKELRGMLDDLGLKVAGTHTGLDTLLDDEFDKTVEFNKTIGNEYLIVPGLPEEYQESIDAWKRAAGILSEVADRLKPHGMKTGYHNHWVEFDLAAEGIVPWDAFAQASNDGVVLQLDTGNAAYGGADPVEYLKKYPGRAETVHVKELRDPKEFAVFVGDGDVKWDDILGLCATTAGTKWFIVEQESYPEGATPVESVARSLRNLRAMGW
jgi:sugar phosphate isomerase/epimerase